MKKKIFKFCFIAAPTVRSKCYLYYMIKNNISPNQILLLHNKEQKCDIKKNDKIDFDPQISLNKLISLSRSPVIKVKNDLNSISTIELIKKSLFKYFVFSGPPGKILNKEFFQIKKKFIHIHGGYLPKYKGSTAFYYSILDTGKIGVSSILMDEGIDTGAIINRKNYSVPLGINIDFIYDPFLRAKMLVETILNYNSLKKKKIEHKKHLNNYYVIHPVLKYFALKKCGLIKN